MAIKGTPNAGLDDIASLAYIGIVLTLVAYTNAANSLGAASVAADLAQPATANGYTPISLTGTWASASGVLTYTHVAGPNNFNGDPGWQASGAWSGTVNGIALLHGAVLRHFSDLATPFVAASLKKLVIDLATVAGG